MGAFRLGDLQVDPTRNLIAASDASWSIEPKVMDLLVLLASRPGEVMSREHLIEQVWRVEYGADESLTRAVSLLRKTFRDAGHVGDLIETIPKRGYRLTPQPEPLAAPFPAEGRQAAPASASPPPSPVPPPTASESARPALPPASEAEMGRRRRTVRWAALAAAVILAGVVLVAAITRWAAPAPDRSIAVLPFASEPADSERAFLGRVTPGEIIDILSQVQGIEVIARNSSFTFKPDADVREVGQKLDVAHVLSGAVSEADGQVKVSTTLADARTGRVIWTRNDTAPFDPQTVPGLQRLIAERVAGAMSIGFRLRTPSSLTGGSTRNLEAYDSYLRGMNFWWFGGGSPDEWVEAFAHATRLDPDFAEAWAGQAFTTAFASMNAIAPEDALAQQAAAYGMAIRAVDLAPDLSVTQASLGALSTTQKKWGAAEIATLKALEISRGDLPLMHRLMLLARVGRSHEAEDLIRESENADPLIGIGPLGQLGARAVAGRTDELMQLAERRGWFTSKSMYAQANGLMARIHAGRPAADIRASLEALSAQADPDIAGLASRLLAAFDKPDEARAVLHAAYDDPAFRNSLKWELIPILAAWVGDTDLVLRVWRDELPVNTMRTIYIWGAAYALARARPEFKQLARDIGFVDYWRAYRWADTCRPLQGDDFECK